MEIFWSILSIIIGIGIIIYSYRERVSPKKNTWDAVMTYRGYVGGVLFIAIGLVTLYRGW